MRKLFTILTLCLLLSIPVFSQSPGIVAQHSLSFETVSSSQPLANYGLVTFYPSGGGSFDVPNQGVVSQNYLCAQASYEMHNVRVISKDSGGTAQAWFGHITYLTPGQINIYADPSTFLSCPYLATLGDNIYLQKKVGSVWTDISQEIDIPTALSDPQTSVVYNGSTAQHNADLYIWNGSAYVFYKKTLNPAASPLSGLNANDNPRSVNGQPSIISFYLSNAELLPNSSIAHFCSTNGATIKFGGTTRNDLLVGTYAYSGYYGVSQLNVFVPSTITNTTTIQLGSSIEVLSFGCQTVQYGNIAVIPNWVN